METATFAAGSSLELEAALRALDGVRETREGTTEEPAYEAVEVDYDPWRVSYDDLLEVFWAKLDPAEPLGDLPPHGRAARRRRGVPPEGRATPRSRHHRNRRDRGKISALRSVLMTIERGAS